MLGEGSHARRRFPALLFSRLCPAFPNRVTQLHVQRELLRAPMAGTACCLLVLSSQHTPCALRALMGNNHQQLCSAQR